MLAVSRRSLLRAGGAALGTALLAGCVGGGRLRRYRIEADAVPSGLAADIEAAATVPPSRDHPLVVEITFTSTAGEATAFAVRPGTEFPFGTVTTSTGDPVVGPAARTPSVPPRLVVAPRGERGELVEECWWDTDGEGEARAAEPVGSIVELEPNESVSTEVVVLNHADNEGCYPFGSYHFAETFWSGEAVEARDGDSGQSWGFSLDVVGLERAR